MIRFDQSFSSAPKTRNGGDAPTGMSRWGCPHGRVAGRDFFQSLTITRAGEPPEAYRGQGLFEIVTDNPRWGCPHGRVAGRDFFQSLPITRVFGLLKKVLQGGFLRKDIQGRCGTRDTVARWSGDAPQCLRGLPRRPDSRRQRQVRYAHCAGSLERRCSAMPAGASPPPRLKISKAVSQSGTARKT